MCVLPDYVQSLMCLHLFHIAKIWKAMIFLAQVKDPVKTLMDLDASDNKRKMF